MLVSASQIALADVGVVEQLLAGALEAVPPQLEDEVGVSAVSGKTKVSLWFQSEAAEVEP